MLFGRRGLNAGSKQQAVRAGGISPKLLSLRIYDTRNVNGGPELPLSEVNLRESFGRVLLRGFSLALLQKYAAAGAGNADYRAFTAALLQQQSRHKEAVDEYLAALRIAPQTGVWWVGLAISQEAMEKKSDAFESFQRARATRSLSPDVAAYAEQRVRQLQPAQ